MNVDEALKEADTEIIPTAAEPFSVAWWQSRSTDELREFINRGHRQGPVFDAASAETERRARERLKETQRAAEANVARMKRIRRLILEMLLLTTLAVLVIALIVR
jgi:CO dehydrogenase/acetyl-CoA synthase beta subunit